MEYFFFVCVIRTQFISIQRSHTVSTDIHPKTTKKKNTKTVCCWGRGNVRHWWDLTGRIDQSFRLSEILCNLTLCLESRTCICFLKRQSIRFSLGWGSWPLFGTVWYHSGHNHGTGLQFIQPKWYSYTVTHKIRTRNCTKSIETQQPFDY